MEHLFTIALVQASAQALLLLPQKRARIAAVNIDQ
jgi:hypothetical protein